MNLFLFQINASNERIPYPLLYNRNYNMQEESTENSVIKDGKLFLSGFLPTTALLNIGYIKEFLLDKNQDVEENKNAKKETEPFENKNPKEETEPFENLKIFWHDFEKISDNLQNGKNCYYASKICTVFVKYCLMSLESDLKDFLKKGNFDEKNQQHIVFYKNILKTIKDFSYNLSGKERNCILLKKAFDPLFDLSLYNSSLDPKKAQKLIFDINESLGVVQFLESTPSFLEELSKIQKENKIVPEIKQNATVPETKQVVNKIPETKQVNKEEAETQLLADLL